MRVFRSSNWPLYLRLQILGFLAAGSGLISLFVGEQFDLPTVARIGHVLGVAGVFVAAAGLAWMWLVRIPRGIRELIAEPPWRVLGRIDSRTGRPRIIKGICLLAFAAAGGQALVLLLDAALPPAPLQQPRWTPGFDDAFLTFGTALALVGYWRMRRWGVWLLGTIVVLASLVWMFTDGVARDWSALAGLVILLLIGVRYYQRMTWSG